MVLHGDKAPPLLFYSFTKVVIYQQIDLTLSVFECQLSRDVFNRSSIEKTGYFAGSLSQCTTIQSFFDDRL